MKKVILLLISILFSVSQGKVWRVDKNTALQADYTGLQPAIDAIPAGDTILVSGYGATYGNIVVRKQVVIIGPGYFLDQYYNTTVNQNSAQLGSVTFDGGGENSEIMGCVTMEMDINCNNITIKRNYIKNQSSLKALAINNVNNIIVQQNYIVGAGGSSCYAMSGNGDNLIIRNNVFLSLYPSAGSVITGSGVISNNVFDSYISVTGMLFNNNIIAKGGMWLNNSIANNNLAFGEYLSPTNGNLNSVDMATVFIGSGTPDGKWQLKDGSPAKGAGLNGTDCGMFGGEFPYILSGIPPIPTIYEAIIPPTGNARDGLQIKIKARTNK